MKGNRKIYNMTLFDLAFGGKMPQLYFPELEEEEEDGRAKNGTNRHLKHKNANMRFKRAKQN